MWVPSEQLILKLHIAGSFATIICCVCIILAGLAPQLLPDVHRVLVDERVSFIIPYFLFLALGQSLFSIWYFLLRKRKRDDARTPPRHRNDGKRSCRSGRLCGCHGKDQEKSCALLWNHPGLYSGPADHPPVFNHQPCHGYCVRHLGRAAAGGHLHGGPEQVPPLRQLLPSAWHDDAGPPQMPPLPTSHYQRCSAGLIDARPPSVTLPEINQPAR